MAAPMANVLRTCCVKISHSSEGILNACKVNSTLYFPRHASSWTSFFRGSKEEKTEEDQAEPRKLTKFDGPTTTYGLSSLKKREGVGMVRGYSPPSDVEKRTIAIATQLTGQAITSDYRIDDRLIKFQLLTTLMKEFDHVIPNTVLAEMSTVGDAISYFSKPVKDKSAYEDLAKLDLPRNLHIQLEPVRFDPETDTFFDGKTAFPGRPTIVSSLKYRRKFKGTSGESRNQKSKTNYEMEKELTEERDRAKVRHFPSEGITNRQPNQKMKQEENVPIV